MILGITTSHLSEWLSSKGLQITSVGEDVKKSKPFYTVGGNVNWLSHCGKQYGSLSTKLKLSLSYDQAIPLLGIDPKESQIH